MDGTREQFDESRREMIAAFSELSTLALRGGVDQDVVTALHGRFFDGNILIKDAFEVAVFMAELRDPHQ